MSGRNSDAAWAISPPRTRARPENLEAATDFASPRLGEPLISPRRTRERLSTFDFPLPIDPPLQIVEDNSPEDAKEQDPEHPDGNAQRRGYAHNGLRKEAEEYQEAQARKPNTPLAQLKGKVSQKQGFLGRLPAQIHALILEFTGSAGIKIRALNDKHRTAWTQVFHRRHLLGPWLQKAAIFYFPRAPLPHGHRLMFLIQTRSDAAGPFQPPLRSTLPARREPQTPGPGSAIRVVTDPEEWKQMLKTLLNMLLELKTSTDNDVQMAVTIYLPITFNDSASRAIYNSEGQFLATLASDFDAGSQGLLFYKATLQV